jgi:hypothetical protein
MITRAALGLAGLLTLASCGTVTMENFPATEQILKAGQYVERRPLAEPDSVARAIDERVGRILGAPLSMDGAVEIAMLRHPDLQAIYGRNQQYGDAIVANLERPDPSGVAVEVRAVRAALLTSASSTDPVRFAEIHADATRRFLGIGTAVRRAYWSAVAQGAIAAIEKDATEAARAAATLANEQFRSGTLARAEQARLVLEAARAVRSLRKAEADALAARETLARQLGLWGAETAFTLPDRLPDLPPRLPPLPDLEARAVSRLDVLADRGLVGIRMSAAAARSEARTAHAGWIRAHEDALQIRDAMLPAQQAVLAETQLRYNAMLVDLYALMRAVREGLVLRQDYVASVRDYLLAEITLETAIGAPRLADAVTPRRNSQ